MQVSWLLMLCVCLETILARPNLIDRRAIFHAQKLNAIRLVGGLAGLGDGGGVLGRDIHGGGTGLTDPYAPRQGWVPTYGCTRGQNEDVQRLGNAIQEFQRRHPGIQIPYTRRD